MDIPIVNGTSYLSLYAASEQLYKRAVKFYTEILKFKQEPIDKTSTWLKGDGEYATTSMKLSVDSARGVAESQISANVGSFGKQKNTTDWVALQSGMCFKTVEPVANLAARLQSANIPFQLRPDELEPVELLLVDPLGALVAFSAFKDAFSETPATAVKPLAKVSVPEKEEPNHPSRIPNTESRNIAVMTSGGDAPGMNAVVRAVVRAAIARGCKAYAIYEGYEGLLQGGPSFIREMHWQDVRGWLVDGGTNIGTARCMGFKERAGRLRACKNMISAGIDALIVCGGDGSLTGADLFRSEWPSLIEELKNNGEVTEEQYARHKHLNICGTVGSIDNDMSSTDATIGAYSSLARICQAIDYIDATANSHSRAFVVEVMGRHCGWLALMAGIATSADYILIPEKPSAGNWEDQMCEIVSKHRQRGKRKTIVIVAEGAISHQLDPISSKAVKDVLVDRLGLDTRITTLGHVQRGGTAVAFDRTIATLQGVEAVNAVLECTPETPSPMIGIAENKLVRRDLMEAVKLTKSVADAIGNKDFKYAMSLRDTEFTEHLVNFVAINSADHNEPTLPVEKRKKIAIVNVGAPAGGMNSAVYAMATYCMSRGHVPYAIHNGFSGLSRHESVRSIEWLPIEGWTSLGGSEIGTNRTLPEEADIGMIAHYFEKYGFDGLVLVGGFEAFLSLNQLEKARASYPAFRIPMVLIPATISNNVPGTEYSLGSDTCLNALMEYCDVVKQSAAATRERVFVVEVQGGNSGYIATFAQLISGAQASYVPEEGISLQQLQADIDGLREVFETEKGETRAGKLVLKSAKASDVLTTDVLANIIIEESHKVFDAKTAVPGHVQQGGIPSPIDRTRAARFAIKAVQFIENEFDNVASSAYDPDFLSTKEIAHTASVLGVQGTQLKFTPIRHLYDFETELGKRMRKEVFWNDVRATSDQLVGRKRV